MRGVAGALDRQRRAALGASVNVCGGVGLRGRRGPRARRVGAEVAAGEGAEVGQQRPRS